MQILIFFILNTLDSTMGNMKTLLLNRDTNLKYLIQMVSAVIFIISIKQVSQDKTPILLFVFVLAKVLGLFFTDILNKKIIKKVYTIHLFTSKEKEEKLIYNLQNENISFTRTNGYYFNNMQNVFIIHMTNSQYNCLFDKVLEDSGITNPTYSISESQVFGKITDKLNLH